MQFYARLFNPFIYVSWPSSTVPSPLSLPQAFTTDEPPLLIDAGDRAGTCLRPPRHFQISAIHKHFLPHLIKPRQPLSLLKYGNSPRSRVLVCFIKQHFRSFSVYLRFGHLRKFADSSPPPLNHYRSQPAISASFSYFTTLAITLNSPGQVQLFLLHIRDRVYLSVHSPLYHNCPLQWWTSSQIFPNRQ